VIGRPGEAEELPSGPEELEEEEARAGTAGSAPTAAGEEGGSSEEPAGEGSPEPLLRISREELQRGIEALLFATGEPVPVRQLSELFEASLHDVREVVEELRLEYVNTGRSFRIEDIAGGVQILTLSRYEPWIRKYLSRARDSRLSPAAFETLSVIAYKQPINKADLEAIRGVQCGPILKTLLDRNLIKVVGREESLGKPLLYGTTRRFLESFGLSSIAGLPQPELDAPPGPVPSPAGDRGAAGLRTAGTESRPAPEDGHPGGGDRPAPLEPSPPAT
jgi:segregation and condensation protein B